MSSSQLRDGIDWAAVEALSRAGDWDGLRVAMSPDRRDVWLGTAGLEEELRVMLLQGARLAREGADVQALFFELDSAGRTGLFLCHDFLPADDWPADFTLVVHGPVLGAGELPADDLRALAGVAFAAFGRALSTVTSEVPWPVGLGLHDGDVLYAPLPPGAMRPEDVQRSVVSTPTGGWYRLEPVSRSPFKHAHADPADEAGRAFTGWLEREWREQIRFGSLTRTFDGPPVTLRLMTGDFEDILRVGAMSWIVSERLVAALRGVLGPDEGLVTVEVAVADQDGTGTRRYFACRPTKRLGSVLLAPEHRHAVARGRAMPAYRRTDVAGSHVFDEDTRDFRTYSVATVSSTAFAALKAAGCLVGFMAVEQIVLEPREIVFGLATPTAARGA
ncbi:hypothetical protein [Pengzhenrongella sp.]|jgi:hypothetical protein|uniref:hypothetical protein n=1 Tax=Pengzhenrongella sp. TaxID=2888820 RepID=UPI002F91E497